MKIPNYLYLRTFRGRFAAQITALAGCALLAISAISLQAQELTDDLVGYWSFDGNMEDSSEVDDEFGGPGHGIGKVWDGGNHQNAPENLEELELADPMYVPGKFGDCIKFKDSFFVQIPTELEDRYDFGAIDALDEDDPEEEDPDLLGFTVSAWVTVDQFTKSWQCLAGKGEQNQWRMHRRGDGRTFTGNGGNGDTPDGVIEAPEDEDGNGTWYHVVLRSDRINDNHSFWVNGTKDAEEDGITPEGNVMPMMIGQNPDTGDRTWEGNIDDVATWKRPLSDEEILELWNGGEGTPVDDFISTSDPDVAGSKSAKIGPIPIVDTDTAFEFSVRNSGETKNLEVSDFVLSGPDADHFAIVETPSSLGPKERAAVKMTFNGKQQLGEFRAQVTYKTNDPDADEQTITVALTAVVPNPLGPVAHYPLDETDASGEAADTTGNGNLGNYEANGGSVTLGGAALAGEGSSLAVNGGGQFRYASGFPLNTSFTISLWFTPNALGNAAASDLLTIVGQGSSSPEVALLLASGELHWFGDPDAPDVLFSTDGVGIEIGQTYHVALVYDRAAGKGSIVLDGVEVASGDVPPPNSDGGFYAGAFGPGALGFDGDLDDIQFYNRALTLDDPDSNNDIAFIIANPGQVITPFGGIIDSDLDGISDSDEIAAGTDPFKADTDGDGVADGDEVDGLDPLNPDSDGDGLSDGTELAFGSDPRDPESKLGTFLVRTVKGAAGIQFGGMDAFKDALADPDMIEEEHIGNFTFINFRDNAQGHFANDELPFALWTTFADRNDFGIYVKGTIKISQAGVRTFGVNSDDGFELQIDGQVVAEFPDPRGSADTFGSVDLSEGEHELELWFYERGGGAQVEMFVNTELGDVQDFAEGSFVLLPAFGDAVADADGDGLNDFFEETHFGNNDATPDGDPDGDGLNNLAEQEAGTNPNVADTDGDGLDDNAEIASHNTDPTNPDSDGDGLSDGAEVNTHNTDPLKSDTDGDGFNDSVEVAGGFDPLDASTPTLEEFLNDLPTPVIAYDFNEGSGTAIGNSGSGADGELKNAHANAWVASGSPDGSGYLEFDDAGGGPEAMHIATGISAADIPVSGDVDYTMMAWVNFANNAGDNMIFGQAVAQPVLHHGARAAQYYMAHWGNDIGAGTIRVNDWQHVVYRYGGGVQSIFVDGALVGSEAKGGLTNEGEIAIGTTLDGEDRDFSGLLDDVRIYNTALNDGVIAAIAASVGGPGPVVVDRPGTIGEVIKSSAAEGGALSFGFQDGTTFDVQYSVDLETWTTIANGVTGTFEDTDAARNGSPAGYYRGVVP